MLWALISYIFFWVAFFCLVLVGLLYLSGRTQSDWLKRFSGRFGETSAETAHVRGILRRFGIVFLAAAMLLLLLTRPTSELSPEEQGVQTLLEVACALTILWQIKGIRDLVKTPQGRSVRNR